MKHTLSFLQKLLENNNREWFQAHKNEYEASRKEFKLFVSEVEQNILSHDQLITEKTKVFRIYRDVRFSNDKTPYRSDWRASFKREGAERRGGYYLRICPSESALVGGFFGPEPKDLLHIRKQIQQEPDRLREILSEGHFRKYFGELKGEQVKSAPKGFSKDDPAIDLLRFKQFMVRHDFTDDEVMNPDFPKKVAEGYQRMRPFFDYMSEILTTDLNGESLL